MHIKRLPFLPRFRHNCPRQVRNTRKSPGKATIGCTGPGSWRAACHGSLLWCATEARGPTCCAQRACRLAILDTLHGLRGLVTTGLASFGQALAERDGYLHSQPRSARTRWTNPSPGLGGHLETEDGVASLVLTCMKSVLTALTDAGCSGRHLI